MPTSPGSHKDSSTEYSYARHDSAETTSVDPYEQDFASAYHPAHFRAIHFEVGKQLDALLTQRDNLIRMTTASDLGRPAAQIVAAQIKAAFPSYADSTHFKQYCGHRIRSILNLLGYQLDQPSVRIPNGVLFSFAARYRKRSDDSIDADKNDGDETLPR